MFGRILAYHLITEPLIHEQLMTHNMYMFSSSSIIQ